MTPGNARWPWHLGAAAGYALVSVLCIGHGASLTRGLLGAGSDPLQFVWFLAWFPWAIAHHHSLLFTHLMWQPLGVPLLWVSSVPLPSLLLIPATSLLGPVVVYNLLILAAPVLSALCAYALCLDVCRNPAASILGGYVYGFSAYEMAADLATPNLSLSFLLPCLALLAWRRPGGRRTTTLLAAALLVAQFFISIEIFATTLFFGFLSWLLAYALLAASRPRLRALLGDAALAGALTGLCLSPYLLEMARHFHYINLPALWPYYFVADLANFIIPTRLTLLGGNFFWPVAKHFPGILQEQGTYIGLPLLLILLSFARARQEKPARFLLALWLLFGLASLGPQLWVDGRFTGIALPWSVFLHLPCISQALPVRFALFVSLVSALILALWIAQARSAKIRLLAGALACLALLPAPHAWMPLPVSKFFAPHEVQAQLGPHPTLLVLPFGPNGASTFWQEENHFGFAQTGGYLGFPPASMQHFRAVGALFGHYQGEKFVAELKNFCQAAGTQYIVAGPGTSAALWRALGALGWPQRRVDDVTIFTVPGVAHG